MGILLFVEEVVTSKRTERNEMNKYKYSFRNDEDEMRSNEIKMKKETRQKRDDAIRLKAIKNGIPTKPHIYVVAICSHIHLRIIFLVPNGYPQKECSTTNKFSIMRNRSVYHN